MMKKIILILVFGILYLSNYAQQNSLKIIESFNAILEPFKPFQCLGYEFVYKKFGINTMGGAAFEFRSYTYGNEDQLFKQRGYLFLFQPRYYFHRYNENKFFVAPSFLWSKRNADRSRGYHYPSTNYLAGIHFGHKSISNRLVWETDLAFYCGTEIIYDSDIYGRPNKRQGLGLNVSFNIGIGYVF